MRIDEKSRPLSQGPVFPQLSGVGVRSASRRIPAPGADPDWAGVGPVGGTFFDENVDFPLFL